MAVIQLAGYAAFILASLVLGTRLVLLWRRTREWPELIIGASFWLAGGLGYMAWLALGVLIGQAADSETIKRVAMAGLAFTAAGAFGNGIGTALIFRPAQRWAKIFVACMGLGLLACWSLYASRPAGDSAQQFWQTILMVTPLYVWGAVESISLASVLRKRARLGLSDPLVANRTMLFGICNAAVVTSIAISYSAQLVHGITPPPWTATLASSALLVGAGAIWLGFFPPASYPCWLHLPSNFCSSAVPPYAALR